MTIRIENVDDLSEPCLSAFMRGVKASEARIIKLLEEIDNRRTHAESLQCGFCTAVALIKGKAE